MFHKSSMTHSSGEVLQNDAKDIMLRIQNTVIYSILNLISMSRVHSTYKYQQQSHETITYLFE